VPVVFPLFAFSMPSWGWVLLVLAGLVVLGRVQDRRGRAFRPVDSRTGFAAVGGAQEALEDLRELVDVLADPEKYRRFGATMPKGALLVGPPGTGKTLLARSVAAEAGVPFISASGSDFVEMFVGVGAKRIRELYAEARSHDRAIVFIDEIDAVARRRSSDPGLNPGSTAEHENTLIALLTELDGFHGSDVVTIAATNRPDVLDPAVTRPGRLDRRIEVPVPDRPGREAILGVHVRNKPLAADVDLAALAARTPGMSGADLARVANEAALGAIRRGLDVIDASCFDDAVELVALGRPRSGAVVTERDRRITAWHEAGHTVAALMLVDAEDPVAVSIVPRGPAGGVTWMGSSDDRYLTRDQAESSLVVMLAGRAAEEVLLGGSCTQGASSDLAAATDLATSMVDRYGFTDRGLSVRTVDSSASRRAIDALLDDARRRARDLLEVHAGLLEAVADALLERDRLDRGDLVTLRGRHAGVFPSRTASAPVGSTRTIVSRAGTQESSPPVVSLLRRLPRLAYRGVTALRPRRRHRI
jgi:cell division protease FtsH